MHRPSKPQALLQPTSHRPSKQLANELTQSKGLSETGYVEGQNLTVEYHWLEGQQDRLPGLLAGLVRHQVAVLATAGNVTRACGQSCNSDDPDRFRRRRRPCKFLSRAAKVANCTARLTKNASAATNKASGRSRSSVAKAASILPMVVVASRFRRLMCCVIMWQPAG